MLRALDPPLGGPQLSPAANRSERMTRIETAQPRLEELVRRATGGDRAAFERVYARTRVAVHAAVLARVAWREVHDVVQETYVTAWLKLPELREPAAFPGWILAIARRAAGAHTRRQREHAEVAAPTAIAPVPTLEAREALAAIQRLPDAYRETLVLRLVHGLGGPEIAEATGLAPESVRVNLCRGMKLLRAALDGGDV